MPAEIGKPAPDFKLRDTDNNEVTLDSFKGKKTVVVFLPFPWTGICDSEACAIRDDNNFEGLDGQVVVITTYPRPALKHWKEENNFTFPVLSDFWPHGATAAAYGCLNEALGVAMRASFVLDKDGIVREIIQTDALPKQRDHADYGKALSGIS